MTGHPKWCDAMAHISGDDSHFSAVFEVDNHSIYLWGNETEPPLLVIARADGKDGFGRAFTLDQARLLSTVLISLLARTE